MSENIFNVEGFTSAEDFGMEAGKNTDARSICVTAGAVWVLLNKETVRLL